MVSQWWAVFDDVHIAFGTSTMLMVSTGTLDTISMVSIIRNAYMGNGTSTVAYDLNGSLEQHLDGCYTFWRTYHSQY